MNVSFYISRTDKSLTCEPPPPLYWSLSYLKNDFWCHPKWKLVKMKASEIAPRKTKTNKQKNLGRATSIISLMVGLVQQRYVTNKWIRAPMLMRKQSEIMELAEPRGRLWIGHNFRQQQGKKNNPCQICRRVCVCLSSAAAGCRALHKQSWLPYFVTLEGLWSVCIRTPWQISSCVCVCVCVCG